MRLDKLKARDGGEADELAPLPALTALELTKIRLTAITTCAAVLALMAWLTGADVAAWWLVAGAGVLGLASLAPLLRGREIAPQTLALLAAGDGLVVVALAATVGMFMTAFLVVVVIELAYLLDRRQASIAATGGAMLALVLVAAGPLLVRIKGFPLVPFAAQGPLLAVSLLVVLAISGPSMAGLATRYRLVLAAYERRQAVNVAELAVAREIQQTLMAPPQWDSGPWSVAALSIPAREVGGDFYEYIAGNGNSIGGIAVGDVAGKGVPAALLMAVVRTIFRIEARRNIFPADSLTAVNWSLMSEATSGMVTMVYAYIDPVGGWMHFANAGHNYPLVMTRGKVAELQLPGLPLGIDDEVAYQEQSVRIPAGCTVLFYTDGLVEAQNEAGEMFGFERLYGLMEASAGLRPGALVHHIADAVRQFSGGVGQSDDITLVALHHAAPGEVLADFAASPVLSS